VDSVPLLEVKHLKTQFFIGKDVYHAVDDVSFFLKPQETLALVGESGSGKSVTANSILQIVPDPPGKIVGGEIIFEGENLLDKTEEQMRRIRGRKISMIFQEPMTSLNPIFRVGEQITEAILLHQTFTDDAGRTLPKREAKKRAAAQAIEILGAVGIPNPAQRMKDFPHQLSGGMRQRVMIAMALVCHPRLLIADEPTSALDVTVQAQILRLLRAMQEEFDTAVLLITHDFGIVAENADDVAVMYAGQIVEIASVDDIFARPLHPYTQGLLKSIPRIDRDEQNLYVIKGTVPNSAHYPVGCRFAERCPLVEPRCLASMPELESISHDHLVRCFVAQEAARG
jgi:oligopeptide/dipeptide ABC transporter ATP-binding protein